MERGSVSDVSWFQMTVEGAGDIAEVTSPTHPISVTPKEGNRLDVGLSEEKAPSGDLVILLKQASSMGHVLKEMMRVEERKRDCSQIN